MKLPLITTKFLIPPLRHASVQRARLAARLDGGLRLGHPLILVAAPAGYGKTTVVREWLQGLGPGVGIAWLSLDDADNEPSDFVRYLAAALRQSDEAIGIDAETALSAPHPPDLARVMGGLINDLATSNRAQRQPQASGRADELARRMVIVLDDYHTITSPKIHQLVALLVENLPSRVHLVLPTRADPPLPLPRLRGRGHVTELRQADLRFSAQETAQFLQDATGLALPEASIAALEERTEGWIAGLQMVALSIRRRGPEAVAQIIERFSGRHHFILDYLTDEVLSQQPEWTRDFLLRTSVLKRMCAPLCDAVLAGASGDRPPPGPNTRPANQSILEHLARTNAFVVPLDDERVWYRYHHLFADLLRARFLETSPQRVAELHRRAADWFDHMGLVADAVHHALAIPDNSLVADVLERAVAQVTTWSSVSAAVFLGWLDALPQETVRARPWLWLYASRALAVAGDLASAERRLRDIEELVGQDPDAARDSGPLLQRSAADRASYALLRGEVRAPVRYAESVLAAAREGDARSTLRPLAMLGIAQLRAGDVRAAERASAQAIAAARSLGLGPVEATLLCGLAEVEIAQGQLRRAWRTSARARELAPSAGSSAAIGAIASLTRARILYQWDDVDAAEHTLSDILATIAGAGSIDSRATAYVLSAQIRQARGDPAGALDAIAEADELARSCGVSRIASLVSAHRSRLWVAQGKLDRVARWAEEYRETGETEYLREFEDLTLARAMLASGQSGEATRWLNSLLGSAEAAGRVGSEIEILALRALCIADCSGALHGQAAPSDDAIGSLARALGLAQPERYVRVFVDEGNPMRVLLAGAPAPDSTREYVERLLASFTAEGSVPRPDPAGQQPLIEPLSPREMEVLRLLAEGLTNPEIGQRLFIAIPTVKSHTSSIYGKLGVHRRRDAVARARSLGLLPKLT